MKFNIFLKTLHTN